MPSQRLGEAFVDVVVRGLAKVQADLGKVGQQLNQIGSFATRGFAVATGAIGGFVRMTDPRGFDNLTVALARVSIQLGRFFVPLLREVTGWINRLADWLRNLSDTQREQVLNWTRLTLGILAVGAVLPRVISLVSGVAGVLGTLRTVFVALGASTPIGWLLAIIAAAVGLAAAFDAGSGGVGGLGQAFATMRDVAASVWAALQPLAAAFLDFGRAVLPVVVSAITAVANVVVPLIQVLTQIATAVLPALATVVNLVWAGLQQLATLFTELASGVLPVLAEVLAVVWSILSTVAGVIVGVADAIGGLISWVESITDGWGKWILAIGAVILLGPKLLGLFGVIVGGIGMVKTALLSLMASNPVGWILGIVGALAGLIGAFGGAGGALAEFDQASNRLNATLQRLRAGQRVTREDLQSMSAEFRADMARAQTQQQRQAAIAAERQRIGQTQGRGVNFDALAADVASGLQAEEGAATAVRDVTAARRRIIAAQLARHGINANQLSGEQRRALDTAQAGSNINAGFWGTGTLGEQRRGDIGRQISDVFRRPAQQLEVLGRLERQGGGTGPGGNAFRGEVRQRPVEFVNIIDMWKKAMQSPEETPEQRIAREQLSESRRAANGIEQINRRMANQPPGNNNGFAP